MPIRQTKKKCLRYECQDQAFLSIRNIYDSLIRGQAAVIFAEMDEEAMVCYSKKDQEGLTFRRSKQLAYSGP